MASKAAPQKMTGSEITGNALGFLGILAIPAFIGIIIWANNKNREAESNARIVLGYSGASSRRL